MDQSSDVHLASQPSHAAHCDQCRLHDLCMPAGLTSADLMQLDELVSARIKCGKGHTLFRAGQPFHHLYAISLGQFKTVMLMPDGTEQVCGFQLTGDILGFDGLSQQQHMLSAIALEDAQVCVIEYERLEHITQQVPALARNVHRIMGQEIVRDHHMMVVLGRLTADERVAMFLHTLLKRLSLRGLSSTDLELRMSREDIGSHLGLTVETVSRVLSKLVAMQVLAVKNKSIRILNPTQLQQLNPAIAGL